MSLLATQSDVENTSGNLSGKKSARLPFLTQLSPTLCTTTVAVISVFEAIK
jgi:hypothetical protein